MSILIYVLSSTTVIILSMLLINSKSKLISIICFLLMLINYALLYLAIFTGQTLNITILDSIFETTYQEASSMLMNIKYITIIILSFISAFTSFYFSKKIKVNPIVIKIIYLSSIVYFFIYIFFIYYFFHGSYKDYRNIEAFKETKTALGLYLYNKAPHPLSDLTYFLIKTIDNQDKYKKTENEKKLNENIKAFKDTKADIIIFIMGESSWKKRYSIYGYSLNTTPNMKKFFLNDLNGCVLDGFSQATATRDSVPLSFSFSTPKSYQGLSNEKSVMEIAKLQGYKTYWLSSQEINGLYGSKYGYLTKSMDEVRFTYADDKKIPQLLMDALNESSEKKFIILHLLGSHEPYTNFTKKNKVALPNADNYDLTIHHTDQILNSIFDTLNSYNQPFSLIYTSDHGEIVNVGHGFIHGVSQIEIPLLAYSNNGYDVCNNYKNKKNKYGEINALSNKLILLDMMGVKHIGNFSIKALI